MTHETFFKYEWYMTHFYMMTKGEFLFFLSFLKINRILFGFLINTILMSACKSSNYFKIILKGKQNSKFIFFFKYQTNILIFTRLLTVVFYFDRFFVRLIETL
jgi:hypothetical protein